MVWPDGEKYELLDWTGRDCPRSLDARRRVIEGCGVMDPMDIERLDGDAARDQLGEIEAVYAESFPRSDLGDYRARMRVLLASPGFEAVTAQDEGGLVGFVYGAPLTARASW
ncbi:hypothetical protein [Actinomadura rubrisoli]|uniref:Uncharacterized protein n=1 Tax=Actinomadura rubrisoli TaxID=2530368 RepID=A0A4R5CC80_9ACTN|nr:hypothetical protein [Actinomadura rubrisoli]TDD95833.1 hypothetical protein E1298_04110 [Actinomadura rubrisoli]